MKIFNRKMLFITAALIFVFLLVYGIILGDLFLVQMESSTL